MLCLLLYHCPTLTLGLFPSLSESPAQQIGWTCQIESLEGRDQLSVLRLRSQEVRPSKQGQIELDAPTKTNMITLHQVGTEDLDRTLSVRG